MQDNLGRVPTRQIAENKALLNGDGLYHIVNADGEVVDGFIIENGVVLDKKSA